MKRQVFQNKKTGQMLVTIPKNNKDNIKGDDWVEVTKTKNRCDKCGRRKFHDMPLCDRCMEKIYS